MPNKGIICLFLLVKLVFFTGCDPFGNAETLFPLPDSVWDRAVAIKKYRVFEIKGVSAQEFLTIKNLLLSNGYIEQKRDFNFSASSKNHLPMTIKSSEGILLLDALHSESQDKLCKAAFYIEKEQKLLLGLGVQEQ